MVQLLHSLRYALVNIIVIFILPIAVKNQHLLIILQMSILSICLAILVWEQRRSHREYAALRAELEEALEETYLMISEQAQPPEIRDTNEDKSNCAYYLGSPYLKCAVRPHESCRNCRDYKEK